MMFSDDDNSFVDETIEPFELKTKPIDTKKKVALTAAAAVGVGGLTLASIKTHKYVRKLQRKYSHSQNQVLTALAMITAMQLSHPRLNDELNELASVLESAIEHSNPYFQRAIKQIST